MSIPADDPEIRYAGRWIFDEPSHPWVGWSGSTVSIRFRGSAISADIDFGDEGERLRVIVNGVPEEPARFIPAGRQSVVLASGTTFPSRSSSRSSSAGRRGISPASMVSLPPQRPIRFGRDVGQDRCFR